MLVGAGIGITIKCAQTSSGLTIDRTHGLVVAGAFLLGALLSMLVVVPMLRFNINKRLGILMLGVYAAAVITAIVAIFVL